MKVLFRNITCRLLLWGCQFPFIIIPLVLIATEMVLIGITLQVPETKWVIVLTVPLGIFDFVTGLLLLSYFLTLIFLFVKQCRQSASGFASEIGYRTDWTNYAIKEYLNEIENNVITLSRKITISYKNMQPEQDEEGKEVERDDMNYIQTCNCEKVKVVEFPDLKTDEGLLCLHIKFHFNTNSNKEVIDELKKRQNLEGELPSLVISEYEIGDWVVGGVENNIRFSSNAKVPSKLRIFLERPFLYSMSIFCCFFPLKSMVLGFFKDVIVDVNVELKNDSIVHLHRIFDDGSIEGNEIISPSDNKNPKSNSFDKI